MGGASEVIARLSDGLDTYLERPVRNLYEGLPDGAPIFGGKVDNGYLRGIMGTPTDKSLSGGEMQRIAVARTFMRSMSEEQKVGLLLFDEPSASLDPKAEQGMTSILMASAHVYGMLMWAIAAVTLYRPVLATSRVARYQDDDILDAPVWGPYTTRRSRLVSPFFHPIYNHDHVILTDEYHRHLNESAVIEAGTHEGLMKREGSEYARLWHIQAQAFL